MSLPARKDSLPLVEENSGVIRVGGTRVTLDTVVHAFRQGATPEEILQRYPSLELGAIYSTISYYLEQREWVEGYLRRREQEAAEIRAENETRFPMDELRRRLLARRG
jgi:uncharacterized protein (DUF433 family)